LKNPPQSSPESVPAPLSGRIRKSFLSFWQVSHGGICGRWYFFPVCLIVICGTAFFIGAVPTRVCGHDIFFLLENGWRVVNGQHPHVDYASAWGPVTFLIAGLGLTLSGFTVDGIGYGNAIFGLLISLWSYRLVRDRLEPIPRMLISLYLIGLVVAPYPLGWGVFHTSYAMVYNRFGYALLGLIMLESFETVGGQKREKEEWIGGFSSGVAAGLALFLKITYFFVAALLIGGSVFLRGLPRRRLLGMIAGFPLVAIVMLAYLGFDIQAVLGDWKMAAGSRAGSVSLPDLKWKFLVNTPILVLNVCLGIFGSLAVENGRPGRRNYQLLIFAALVFAADILLIFSNNQKMQLPLATIFSLVVVNKVVARNRTLQDPEADPARTSCRAALFAGGVFFLLQFALELSGLAHGALLKAWPSNLRSVVRFTEPRLVPLLLYDDLSEPRSNGRQYVTYVNEGINLLRNNTSMDETVLTMDMVNPFPYALGRRPAVGGIAATAYRYTLSEMYRPSDERYFGTADIVMVPKQPTLPEWYFDGYYRIYEQGLHDRFRLVAESDMWYLYRRK
jgi:hypothetical protein